MLFFTLTLIEQIIQSLESSLLSFGTPNKVLMHPQPVKDWLSTVRFGYSGKGKQNTEEILNDLVGSIHYSSHIFPRRMPRAVTLETPKPPQSQPEL